MEEAVHLNYDGLYTDDNMQTKDRQNFGSKCRCRIGKTLTDNLLFVLTIAGILVGFAVGFGVRELQPSEDVIMWIGNPYMTDTVSLLY